MSCGRVVVFGSLNVDLVTSVERHPQPGETLLGEGLSQLAGGKGANQAMSAARSGGRVSMIGCVGDDAGGAAYRDRLSRSGIDVSGLRTVEGAASGHALIAVSDDGENTIIVIPGANDEVGPEELAHLDDLGPGDVLLLQLEIPLLTVAAAARNAAERGARVVLNIAPYAGLPDDIIALADPVVANEHEAGALSESGAVPQSLLVTFGANGATWDGVTLPAKKVPGNEVRDTTGAGDAFCGALAAALAAGLDRNAALEAALSAGAEAVRHDGAQPDPAL